MSTSTRVVFSLLLAIGLLQVGACSKDNDKSDKEGSGSIGSVKTGERAEAPPPQPSSGPEAAAAEQKGPDAERNADKTASSAPAAPPTGAAMAPATDIKALTRKILRNSLNSTVDGPSRFETAPLYRLALDVDYELFTYDAKQELHYVNTEKDTLRELNFFLYPNSPDVATPGAKNVAVRQVRVDGRLVEHTSKATTLTVPLPEPLAPGARATITLDFRGNIQRLPPGSSDMTKLAFEQVLQMIMGTDGPSGGYGVFAYGENIVSLALWYPVLAAYDARGWDLHPGSSIGDVSYFDISNYEVSVTAPEDVTVIATGVEVSRTEDAGRRTTTFVAGAVREFTVQMSREYASKSAFVDGVKVTSWFLRSDRKSGEAVLEYARQALKLYNQEFGPYPYTELDVAEAPLVGGAGGVEFPGLVTVAKMFYGSDDAPKDSPMAMMTAHRYMKDTLEFVVVHEVAHQWWNAVVGSDSKRHPFVDEALANHSAVLYFERIHGAEAGELQRELQLRLPYQISRLAGAKDRPVDLPTDQFNGMMEYAAIVYGKGALFFEAMRERFGDRSHFGFLKGYYNKHKFGIATYDDLVEGMITSARDPGAARTIADRWLKETHADEDIGSISIAKVATYLLGDEVLTGAIGQVIKMIDHKGVQEIAKLVQSFLSPDGTIKEDIDYGEIIKLAVSLLGLEEGSELAWVAKLAESVLENPDMLKDGSLRGMAKAVAKTAVGDDKEMQLLIEASDLLLKYLEK